MRDRVGLRIAWNEWSVMNFIWRCSHDKPCFIPVGTDARAGNSTPYTIYGHQYPGYQRVFLACHKELRRPQALGRHILTETGNRAWKASGRQGRSPMGPKIWPYRKNGVAVLPGWGQFSWLKGTKYTIHHIRSSLLERQPNEDIAYSYHINYCKRSFPFLGNWSLHCQDTF